MLPPWLENTAPGVLECNDNNVKVPRDSRIIVSGCTVRFEGVSKWFSNSDYCGILFFNGDVLYNVEIHEWTFKRPEVKINAQRWVY